MHRHAHVNHCLRAGSPSAPCPSPCDLDVIGRWEWPPTPIRTGDLLIRALAGGPVICIEAMRRLDRRSGCSPTCCPPVAAIAGCLRPLYAHLPRPSRFAVGAVLYAGRSAPDPVTAGFSSAALGLAGAVTSATFHLVIPNEVFAHATAARAWRPARAVVLTRSPARGVSPPGELVHGRRAAHLAEPDEPSEDALGRETCCRPDRTRVASSSLGSPEPKYISCWGAAAGNLAAAEPEHKQLAAPPRTDRRPGC